LYLKRKFEVFPDQNLDTETLQKAKLKTKHAVAESKKLLSMNIEKNYCIHRACGTA